MNGYSDAHGITDRKPCNVRCIKSQLKATACSLHRKIFSASAAKLFALKHLSDFPLFVIF